MNEIWNKTFLDNLKDKYKRNQNFLTILAHEIEHFNAYINQCQNMWRELPNHLKCKKLYKDLHTVKEGQFAGAFAELISAWVLNQYFPKVLSEVQVGGFTPDFYGENDNNSFLFETYILGKDYEEKKDDNNKIAFRDEIKNVKSNSFIFLEGSPIPCDINGFSGMAKLLQIYLDNIAETTDETL